MDHPYTESYLTANVDTRTKLGEFVGEPTDPLSLSIDDTELVDIIDKRIENTRSFYKDKYDLYNRRKKNEVYRFGRQIQELEEKGELKKYEAKNLDNVIYEIEMTIKPLAMSQLPDLLVTPGNNTDLTKQVADQLTTVVNSDIKKRQNRKVLALAFQHRPVYFVGIIKCRWNPQLNGGKGDYEFICIHPDLVDFDETATEADADKMKYIAQIVPSTVGEVLMQFPDQKAAFLEELKAHGVVAKDMGEPDWKALATPIEYREVWFTDYDKARNIDGSRGNQWKRVEGVCWKYEKCMLGKMRNPYYDYEGEEQLFTYDDPKLASSKRAISLDEMQSSMVSGIFPPNVSREMVYHNYFEQPRKPFFFMVYDQWGRQPMDETSSLEQNIKNQNTLDKRGKQITETLDNKGHHIWSKESGLKPETIQRMDHNDPNEDYLVDGNPKNVHDYVEPPRPDQAEFADMDRTQQRMYAVSGSQAIRGEIKEDTTATTHQIGREGNYTRADDLVEETINAASEWMAVWSLQMIKTSYTQEHFRKILGKKGEIIFLKLHQNMVDQGMEVMIKSSGTDKIKRQNNAMDMAKMQMTDPLSFYQDMDLDDPEGRTARLVTWNSNLPLYLSAFVQTGPTSTPELVQKLMSMTAMPPPGMAMPPGVQQPASVAMPPQPGAMPPGAPMPQPNAMPQQPSPENTGNVAALPQPQPPAASPRMV